MTLPAPRGYNVYVALYPLRDLATLSISKVPRVYGYQRDRHSSVSFAAVEEDEIEGDRIDVTFPGVGHIEGRFVADRPPSRGKPNPFCRGPRPTFEVGHVFGRLELTGNGFPPLQTSHAGASIGRSFPLRCQPGRAKNPPKRSLFAYIGGHESLHFDNNSEEVLTVESASQSRATSFLAERESEGSTVMAHTEEVLPREEVAIRWVLVEHVAVPTSRPRSPGRPASPSDDPSAGSLHGNRRLSPSVPLRYRQPLRSLSGADRPDRRQALESATPGRQIALTSGRREARRGRARGGASSRRCRA